MQRTTDMSAGNVYRRLLTYVFPYWKVLLLAVGAMLITAATEPAFAALMKPLMDLVFVAKNPEYIRWMPLLIILLFVVRGVFEFISKYHMSMIARNVIKDLRSKMFDHLLYLPVRFYDRHTSGQLISKFSYDVEQVAQASSTAITIIVRDSFVVIGLLVWMFYLNWILSLVFVLAGPPVAALIVFINKRMRRLSLSIQRNMGDVTHAVEQAIRGQQVVKTYGGHAFEAKRFEKINESNCRLYMKLTGTTAASVPIMQFLAACALSGIIYLATLDPLLKHMTVGTFMSFMMSMLLLMPPIKRLTTVNVTMQKGIAAAGSLFSFLDTHVERETGSRTLERATGALDFDRIQFTYGDREKPALDGFSLKIEPGQTVALVGRSGSGKSTVVKLLGRFYEIQSGCIRIDGVDTKEFALKDLRRQFAYVSQDVVLFKDTVANNIIYGQAHVSAEAIMQAAVAAHAMEFIQQLPQGMQTEITESSLSGGQRQRLAIARAIVKNAPILVLDEATSALDNESEFFVQEGLAKLMRDRTTIIIAHRLSTIENADRIVLMDQGRILDMGTHAQLLQRSQYYRNLYEHRFEESAHDA